MQPFPLLSTVVWLMTKLREMPEKCHHYNHDFDLLAFEVASQMNNVSTQELAR